MTNVTGFDWEFYLEYNTDVSECYGFCEDGAVSHYDAHGEDEKRIYSEEMLYKSFPLMKVFDSEHYKSQNKDFVYFTHYQAIKHYLTVGCQQNIDVHFTSGLNILSDLPKPVKRGKAKKIDESKKISVIMVIQDESETVQYAIDSILNQTYKNLEILVVDDDSDKRTKSMLTQYARNPRVILLENESKMGYLPSVDMALCMCSGEYVTVHGPDAISLPNRLEIITSKLNSQPILLSFVFESGLPIHERASMKSFHEILKQTSFRNMYDSDLSNCGEAYTTGHPSLYKLSIFDEVGYKEGITKNLSMNCDSVDEILYIK
jgi:hypothetical protein